MNNNIGKIITPVLELLAEIGPMTAAELSEMLPQYERSNLNITLRRLRTPTLTMGKRAYIKEYRREQEGERRYPRAVYAIGDKKDAKAPGPEDRKEIIRRYRSKLGKTKVLMQSSSVFRVGLRPDQIRADIRRGA